MIPLRLLLLVLFCLVLPALRATASQKCSFVVGKTATGATCECGVGGCAHWWPAGAGYVGCEDGVLNPGDCEPIPPEMSVWIDDMIDECNGNAGVYDNCAEVPSEDQCRNPANHKLNAIGDPVDVTTGALEQTTTDVDLGRGLVFRRHYASNRSPSAATEMGKGWRHSLDWSLTYRQGTTSNPISEIIVVKRPLTSPVTFFRRMPVPPPSPPPPFLGGEYGSGALAGDPASQLTFTDSDGTRVRFDRVGSGMPAIFHVGEIRFAGSPPIAVTHGATSRTYATGGVELTLTLQDGRVTAASGAGQTWGYGYDVEGCLHPNPGSPSGPVIWTYAYPIDPSTGGCDTSDLKRIDRSVNGPPVVKIAEWEYEGTRVRFMEEPGVDQKLYLTYPTTSPDLTCSVRDVDDGEVPALATFVSNGERIMSATGPGGPGVEPSFTGASFATTPAGEPRNRWKTTTDRNGHKTRYENHDARGRPGIVTEGWIDADGDDLPDPGEYERQREILYHPALDRETQLTEPSLVEAGASRVTTYDFDDPVSGEPSALLRRTMLTGRTLDASNQPVPFTDETVFDYTAEGRLRSITGPRPENYTWFDYDPATGARSKVRRHLNGPNSAYLEWTFSNFDARGNPQTVTDPNQRVTTFTYDDRSRVRTVTPPYAGPESATISFTYDVDGNLTQVDFPVDSAGQDVFLRMGYDEKANLLFIADLQQNAIVYEYERSRVTREARYTGFVDYDNDRGDARRRRHVRAAPGHGTPPQGIPARGQRHLHRVPARRQGQRDGHLGREAPQG